MRIEMAALVKMVVSTQNPRAQTHHGLGAKDAKRPLGGRR